MRIYRRVWRGIFVKSFALMPLRLGIEVYLVLQN